jgi:hypothetical protein
MRTALITTTINVPEVLAVHRALDPEVMIFVVGDRNTPHAEVKQFIARLGNAVYFSDTDQEKMGYECSELIGWNSIARRSIGILEALRWGAEMIVSVDDDNLPINPSFFDDFRHILSTPFAGLEVHAECGWFNAGILTVPPVHHRGLPITLRNEASEFRCRPISNVRVGVAAGLWLGDPDIDAIERIVNQPMVYGMSALVDAGIVVSRTTVSPFDSQNTSYLRELAPLMMLVPKVGRYDDIWASYLAQRIMRESEYYLHFGKPLVWQDRNSQSLIRNLKDEHLGMERTLEFRNLLDSLEVGSGTPLDLLARLYEGLRDTNYLPAGFTDVGHAWVKDILSVTE